ncbi:MAG: metal ABC transporter permease [Alkalispirochaeta sp.]
MIWTPLDTWIIVAAVLAGTACALVGSFLVLKKMSMLGDAISHAVLPGIAVAFMISGTHGGGTLFLGAAIVGILTAMLVEVIHRHGTVEHGAAMGVVFSILFAVGLILIEHVARDIDIHPEHVLMGAVELVPLHMVTVLGIEVPRGVAVLVTILLIDVAVVVALFKELRIAIFDPDLATTLGINATFMHYLLMTLVAMTTVAAFEVVGSILVIAMLIVPGATAALLTRRLHSFIITSAGMAAVAAALGHVAAITIPPWFGFEDTSTAGSMAVVLGALFFIAVLFAPERGIVAHGWNQLRLRMTINAQDALGLLARAAERHETREGALSVREFEAMDQSPFVRRRWKLITTLMVLRARGLVHRHHGRYRASTRGGEAGRDLLRTHRLLERYFYDDAHVEMDELHTAADYLEHYTDRSLQAELAKRLRDAATDPRGNIIPADTPDDDSTGA